MDLVDNPVRDLFVDADINLDRGGNNHRLHEMQSQDWTARMVWSGIAEPGDLRTGTLVQVLGPMQALLWALSPFCLPTVDGHIIPDPQSTVSEDSLDDPQIVARHRRVWELVHSRLWPRIQEFDPDQELRLAERMGARMIVPSDPQWPKSFDSLENRQPFMLWVLGQLPVEQENNVAFVGSRAATSYGSSIAAGLAYDCAEESLVVVSGGAYGIDAAAHRGALRGSGMNGSCSTIAVLCGGLEKLYPAGNVKMFEDVLARAGGLVTEMPPSYRPARWRFLERNRLIAAWSQMVVVVEAGLRSGALATANRALELGVGVGAVPGPVSSPTSAGTNDLLKNGAEVITGIEDILFHVRGDFGANQGTTVESGFSNDDRALPSVQDRLDQLSPLNRRVWDALPRGGTATVQAVAAEGGVAETEVETALGALKQAFLVDSSDRQWFRSPRPDQDSQGPTSLPSNGARSA